MHLWHPAGIRKKAVNVLTHFSNGLLDYRKTGEMKRKQRKRKIRKVLEEEIDKT